MSAFVPVFFCHGQPMSILSFYLSCAITNLFILLSKQQVSENIILMFDFLLGHIICQVGHRSCQEVSLSKKSISIWKRPRSLFTFLCDWCLLLQRCLWQEVYRKLQEAAHPMWQRKSKAIFPLLPVVLWCWGRCHSPILHIWSGWGNQCERRKEALQKVCFIIIITMLSFLF